MNHKWQKELVKALSGRTFTKYAEIQSLTFSHIPKNWGFYVRRHYEDGVYKGALIGMQAINSRKVHFIGGIQIEEEKIAMFHIKEKKL